MRAHVQRFQESMRALLHGLGFYRPFDGRKSKLLKCQNSCFAEGGLKKEIVQCLRLIIIISIFSEQFASSAASSTLTDSLSVCVKITMHCMLSNMEAGKHSGALPFSVG